MSGGRRGSWTVTAINGAVAATVLVLVAVLALVVKPPAPPGIAAFAPQAAKAITKAPDTQSAQFGSGAGACGEGQECAGQPSTGPSTVPSVGPSASLPPVSLRGALPAGLQCYEWPNGSVTQTFDPQSPPCVSVWDDAKGNGGATTRGVTPTEIRVALPVTDPANSNWPAVKPIVDFFNTRFQFYGRKITIVPVRSQQADGNLTGAWNDPVLQKADAAQIAAQDVFATFDFMDPIGESATVPVFLDAMKKAKIISINGGDVTPFDTAENLAARAPYAWSYYATIDQLLDNVGTMTCRQLVGKPAVHSTDPALQKTPRKFAVVLPTDEQMGGALPGLSGLLATLDGCGVEDPKVVRMQPGASASGANSASLQQLKSEGVTSLLFLPWGGNGSPGSTLGLAESVRYFPEWVVMGAYIYNTAFMLNDPPSETGGAFGVGVWNKQPQLALEMWNQAVTAVGGDAATSGRAIIGRAFYQEMLLLASGIQMAGPQLTPESFAQGLRETQFPNPGGGTAPFFQGSVGFTGDTVMVDDFTAFWLDTRTSGQQVQNSPAVNQEKAFCMVGRGLRYRDDSWPGKDGYYQPGVCR